MRRPPLRFAAAFVTLASLTLAGCGGSGDDSANNDPGPTGAVAFRNATNSNGDLTDLPTLSGTSTSDGTTFTITLDAAPRRLTVALPERLRKAGNIIPYSGSIPEAKVVYSEATGVGTPRTWQSYSGTVTVVTDANGTTLLRLNNVLMGALSTTSATGGFTLLGTVQGAAVSP